MWMLAFEDAFTGLFVDNDGFGISLLMCIALWKCIIAFRLRFYTITIDLYCAMFYNWTDKFVFFEVTDCCIFLQRMVVVADMSSRALCRNIRFCMHEWRFSFVL